MKQTLRNMETLEELRVRYEKIKQKHLKLNMARGKPSPSQLDLNNDLLKGMDDWLSEDGTDARNYGVLDGLPECRRLFADLLGLKAKQVVIGGNASLAMMFDALAFLCLFGPDGCKAWYEYKYRGTPVKFLCPSPGYDRHFRICEELGIEMIPVPLFDDGPDMDAVASLVKEDELIKGIWCVPLYSNPEGICYSDKTVERLASMETAASDFRIFWDNAYAVHYIYERVELMNILEACERYGNPDRAYYFFSTSKITFPGAGISLVSSSPANIAQIKRHMSAQTIGYDKLNQLRHVQYFKTPQNILAHMDRLAKELRPKFDLALSMLKDQLGGTGLASWTSPKGGYFISFYTPPHCAKRTVQLAKEAGVVLTDAGATYPYGNDEEDRNIRIAPTYPSLEELREAMDVFILCVKIAAMESRQR